MKPTIKARTKANKGYVKLGSKYRAVCVDDKVNSNVKQAREINPKYCKSIWGQLYSVGSRY